jgi:hypothetical protein
MNLEVSCRTNAPYRIITKRMPRDTVDTMGADSMDDILQPQHSNGGDQTSPTFQIFELDRRYATNFIKFPVQFQKISPIAILKVEKVRECY